jgi:hypothetical protein
MIPKKQPKAPFIPEIDEGQIIFVSDFEDPLFPMTCKLNT